jgi:hypothetical protein
MNKTRPKDDGTHEVGDGISLNEIQFKEDECGIPNGRPLLPLNIQRMCQEVLLSTTVIEEGGDRQEVRAA